MCGSKVTQGRKKPSGIGWQRTKTRVQTEQEIGFNGNCYIFCMLQVDQHCSFGENTAIPQWNQWCSDSTMKRESALHISMMVIIMVYVSINVLGGKSDSLWLVWMLVGL